MISFRCVIVDHVQNDFYSRFVQCFHHLLKVLNLVTNLVSAGIFVVRSQVTNRVVSPIISQSSFKQVSVVDELMDGLKLHGRYAQFLEIIDHHGMR